MQKEWVRVNQFEHFTLFGYMHTRICLSCVCVCVCSPVVEVFGSIWMAIEPQWTGDREDSNFSNAKRFDRFSKQFDYSNITKFSLHHIANWRIFYHPIFIEHFPWFIILTQPSCIFRKNGGKLCEWVIWNFNFCRNITYSLCSKVIRFRLIFPDVLPFHTLCHLIKFYVFRPRLNFFFGFNCIASECKSGANEINSRQGRGAYAERHRTKECVRHWKTLP